MDVEAERVPPEESYARSPYDVPRVLSTIDSPGDRPATGLAPEHFVYAGFRLNASIQHRALRMSERANIAEIYVENERNCFCCIGASASPRPPSQY